MAPWLSESLQLSLDSEEEAKENLIQYVIPQLSNLYLQSYKLSRKYSSFFHTWLLQGVFSKCFRACERKQTGP